MKKLSMFVFWVSLGLVAASYGGALHPAGDSLAVLRVWLAVLLFVSALILFRPFRWIGRAGAVVSLVVATPVASTYFQRPGPGGGELVLYQKNLLYTNPKLGAVMADILASDADIVTLQEVGAMRRGALKPLDEAYAGRQVCVDTVAGGMAVYSRWKPVEGSGFCSREGGFAAIQVEMPAGRVWLVSLRLGWPWPNGQPEQLRRLVPALRKLEGPIILAGDFNMVPWSHAVRQIEAASRAKRAGRAYNTLNLYGVLRLPIDHVLTPRGSGETTTRPLLGSDHFGLLVRFDL